MNNLVPQCFPVAIQSFLCYSSVMEIKKPYVEPTLEERDQLVEVTEMATIISGTPPPP